MKNNKKKKIKNKLAPLLACSIIVQSSASGVYALTETVDNLVKTEKENLKIAVLSDPHYYPESYVTDNQSEDYKNYMAKELYLLEESAGMFKAALDMVANDKEKPDLLLIPGDITKNNEKLGYQELNTILTEFEDKTGIEIFLATGNHDVHAGAFKFDESGNKVDLTDEEKITINEYYNLMKNFGFNTEEHNTEFFNSSSNKEEDGLSYVSEPVDGFVILSLNSNTYKYDESGKATGQGTPGFSKELLNWAVDKIKEAEKDGKTVIAMSHHGILPHSTASLLSSSAMIADYEDVATALADAGLRYVFTGHMHENDIAEFTTAKGNTLYDIETGATAGYGSPVRSVTFDKTIDKNNQVKETVEVSSKSVKSAVVKGKTINNLQDYIYDSIYKDSKYLQIKLGGALSGISDALANISLEDLIYGKDAAIEYGLSEKLTEAIFEEFDGDTVKTAEGDIVNFDFVEGEGLKVVSKSRSINEVVPYASLDDFVLSIVREFDSKVFNKEFIDKELDKILEGILGIEVYEADNAQKKVLQDVINLFLIDHFLGAEDLSGWAEDALNELRNGGIVRDLIDGLLDNILGLLDSATGVVNADFKKLDSSIGGLLNSMLGGTLVKAPTLQQVLNKVAKKDLSDIVKAPIDEYLNDYVTPSFEKQFGTLLADLVYGLAGDDSQDDEIDGKSRILKYEGAVEQDPTVENGLLPHSIAVTFGEDETTQKAFSWYTGKNVPTNEIQFVKKSDAKKDANGNVDFSNGTTISAESEIVKRSFPTVDLGLIAITKDKDVARHQIVLNGLQSGTEYYYRVGNADNGIYSEIATFETAAVNDDSFSFLAMGDTQAMLEEEYGTWGTILDIATNRYKDAKFMAHVGDMVDNGKNELQWQWFLNKAQDDLMNTTMITASGNHEDSAPYSQVNHFNIDDLPEQDTKTGAFYKVDYGNALVITLNTSNLEDNKLSQDQINWLKSTAQQSDAKWKIINLHKSTYSNGSHYTDTDVVAIREQLDTVVTEAGIDLVIGGHDHTYARSEFLVNGNEEVTNNIETQKDGITYETAVNPDGTMYVTIGSTGPKFYDPKETGLPIAFQPEVKTHMYAGVTIEGDTLYYNAYTVDVESGTDKLLDSYAITKDSAAPVITGVENNGSYYVDRVISASDNIELSSLTINGVEVESGYVLEASNKSSEYTVVATDISGNTSTVKFNMVGLPVVDDINLDESSKATIERIKAEFNAIKNSLPNDRATYLQNLIYALESRYSALETAADIESTLESLPTPEEVT
ncbi:MAG: metallophosphoesterase, partial [Peptostreptococcaceae bacterium]